MKSRVLQVSLILSILIILAAARIHIGGKDETNIFMLPGLPRPIAKETVLITSAGQSTDTDIIKDIANRQMIRNYFMPQAQPSDLKDINTVVITVGYSPMGLKLNNISLEDEKKRIKGLLDVATENKISVIAVFIGGEQRRSSGTDALMEIVCPKASYLIGTKDANYDGFLSKMAKKNGVPFTLVKGVNDVMEPFVSAFR